MSSSNYQKLITDNYIYLYHLDKFVLIPLYPETITDSMGSEFSKVNPLARTAPVFSYSGSGPRSVQFSIKLHRDMMNEVNTNVSNLKDNVLDFSGDDYIDTLIKYLQASVMPRYKNFTTGTKSIVPPMVAIRFGNDIFIKGVITSAINVTYEKPLLVNGKYACVGLNFVIEETEPYTADDIAASGSFRGITSSFKDGIFESNLQRR